MKKSQILVLCVSERLNTKFFFFRNKKAPRVGGLSFEKIISNASSIEDEISVDLPLPYISQPSTVLSPYCYAPDEWHTENYT
tara:strand:- start:72 stop:317 length:246 start_codon:yes stop_codon:yes gene_type:complete